MLIYQRREIHSPLIKRLLYVNRKTPLDIGFSSALSDMLQKQKPHNQVPQIKIKMLLLLQDGFILDEY